MTVEVINEVTNVTVTQTGPLNIDVSTAGIQGPIGSSNVLSVGTVTQLAPNDTPTVIISGVSPAQAISFGIPVGAQILQGTAVPTGALGQVGFWYIRTSTWDVYEKTAAATWTSRGNIKGATGNTGPAPNISLGTVTQATPGTNGSVTVTGTNPNYVINFSVPLSNWTVGSTSSLNPGSAPTITIGGTALNPTLNIGIPRGSAMLTGTTAPASGTGNQGDWYFNSTTSDLYEKTSSTVWTLRQNLKGATGNTGNTGPANVLSIGTVTTSAAGGSAAATITGTAPTQTLNLTLPRGDTGPTGPAPNMSVGTVTTLAAGASATATVTGSNPNYALNLGIPQGLKGDIGAQWYAGASAPAGGTGAIGDFYLVTGVTGTGDVYKKTGASTWTLQGNIRGQAGTGDVESVNNVLPVGGNVTLTWNDFTGTIPASALPSLSTVETYTVASQAAMLALSAQRGDLAVRTDLEETFVLSGNDPAVLANWTQLLTDGGNVRLTGNQTIAGVKTFSSSPVIPYPSSSTDAANKDYIDSALAGKANTAHNHDAGAITTGTLDNARLPERIQTAASHATDLNTTIESGIYFAHGSTANTPDNINRWGFRVENQGGGRIRQWAWNHALGTYRRHTTDNGASWTNWEITQETRAEQDARYALISHNHAATQITSGTLDIARIPTGTTGTTVALGNHLHTGVYEPLIAAGTTAQYRRGDNTWRDLGSDAVLLTGNQTIADNKTFYGNTTFGGATPTNQRIVSLATTGTAVVMSMENTAASGTFVDMVSNANALSLRYGVGTSSVGLIYGTSGTTPDWGLVSGGGGYIRGALTVGATTTATHTLTLPSTSSGIAHYNTADQTTNYERGRIYWSANSFSIGTENSGTGVGRNIRLLANSSGVELGLSNNTGFVVYRNNTGVSNIAEIASTGLTASSGLQTGLLVDPTINQSGTAGYSAIKVNVTETATGSGNKTLLDLGVGGSSKLRIFSTGAALWVTTGANDSIIQTSIPGDSANRFHVRTDGYHAWGAGTTAADTNLYRSAADTLKTDDSFIVGTNLTVSGLTASRVVTTGTGGLLQSSAVTTTELGYLSGVTSAIQTQLNGKAATSHTHTKSQITDFAHTHAQADITPNIQRFIFTTGSEARPTGSTYVEWVGPVEPTNSINGDTWVNTA